MASIGRHNYLYAKHTILPGIVVLHALRNDAFVSRCISQLKASPIYYIHHTVLSKNPTEDKLQWPMYLNQCIDFRILSTIVDYYFVEIVLNRINKHSKCQLIY